jgi:AcrR family transcriptional regulator
MASTKPATRGDQSRRDILDAAEHLMAHDGYSAVSIARLEDASGLPASSIYWHFGSKERVLLAVMERGAEQFFVTLDRIESFDGEPLERVRALFAAMAQHLSEHPLFLRLLLTVGLQRSATGEAGAVVDHIRSEGLAHAKEISRVVAEAVDHEVDEHTIEEMGRLVMAVADGLVFSAQIGEPIRLEELMQRMPAMLLAFAQATPPA